MSQTRPTDQEANIYANHYIRYGDQTKAFRQVFKKSKASNDSIHAKASLFHKIDKVQLTIKKLEKISNEQSEKDFLVSISSIKEMLIEAASKGLKDKIDQQGNVVPVSISGAVAAVAEINKMDGNHASTKIALSGDQNAPMQVVSMSKDEYKQARKDMIDEDGC